MEPVCKRRRIEIAGIDLPEELITLTILERIRRDNFAREEHSDTGIGHGLVESFAGMKPFCISSFSNCRTVSKRWNRSAENAAIIYANICGGEGFLFLRDAYRWRFPLDAYEDAHVYRSQSCLSLMDLLTRRGSEIHTYANASTNNDSLPLEEPYLKLMPNLKYVRLVNATAEISKGFLEFCFNIHAFQAFGQRRNFVYPWHQFPDKFKNLETLIIDCVDIDLSAISKMTSLKNLSITHYHHFELHAEAFTNGFMGLRSLSLDANDIERFMAPMPNLSHLELYAPFFQNFVKIQNYFPNLEHLTLHNVEIGAFCNMAVATNLKSLSLVNVNVYRLHPTILTTFSEQRTTPINLNMKYTQPLSNDIKSRLSSITLGPHINFNIESP